MKQPHTSVTAVSVSTWVQSVVPPLALTYSLKVRV
jgi:hypothetical protein